jgi:predicted CopG family antitoxin
VGTKNIHVREEVYEQLVACKRPEESFSDLLDRLVDRDAQFEAGFGALADVDFDDRLRVLDDRLDAEGRSER